MTDKISSVRARDEALTIMGGANPHIPQESVAIAALDALMARPDVLVGLLADTLGEIKFTNPAGDFPGADLCNELLKAALHLIARRPFACPRCGSTRGVPTAMYPGGRRTYQCVPCGHRTNIPVADSE